MTTSLGIQGGPKSEITNSWLSFCRILTDFLFFFTGEHVIVSCTLRLANAPLKDEEKVRDNHVLASNFVKYSPLLISFHWQTQQ